MTHFQPSASLVLLGLGFYLLPSFIAVGRRTPHFATGFLINLFLGWTIVGWMYSLAWAALSERDGESQGELQLVPVAQRAHRAQQQSSASKYRRAA